MTHFYAIKWCYKGQEDGGSKKSYLELTGDKQTAAKDEGLASVKQIQLLSCFYIVINC